MGPGRGRRAQKTGARHGELVAGERLDDDAKFRLHVPASCGKREKDVARKRLEKQQAIVRLAAEPLELLAENLVEPL